MPITTPFPFQPLTAEEFGELDYQVMAHAFASHREIGRLADEHIYQADLAARLTGAGIRAEREVTVTVSFRGFTKAYFLDLVVEQRAVYELKAVTALATEHEAQVMNYLFLLDARRGKPANFRPASVESRFINAPATLASRRAFQIDATAWSGPDALRTRIVELLRDWGTGLELPLYRDALIHHLGGESLVTRALPLQRAGIALGPQHFLRLSPLRALHWTNLARTQVTFTTLLP
jgi:GxxExxY protein